MAESVVNIRTLFDQVPRSVDVLKELYNDRNLICWLESIAGSILTEEKLNKKKVLLKPNWVKHFSKPTDDLCLCTHHNFLLAVLELVLSKRPARVMIGDAPIQGCQWDRLITQDLINKVQGLSVKYQVAVVIKDFRRVVFDTISNKMDIERNPLSEYIIFDVGKKSYLEPITHSSKNLFRVSQYNPDKFVETHKPGMHKYCITKELFDADIVISIPKVKTHQKAGITCALKNIVGLNGDKDFLPHHRIGGDKFGGDSYPGGNILRYWSELALDNANRRKGKSSYWWWLKFSILLWKISLPKKHHQMSAAWYGNDTTWRMVMDLNMIVTFGKADGTLDDVPQREFYSFSDGIIGGQGDGPLRPEPLNLGIVAFTNNSAANDIAMAILMGLKVDKIPLLMAAKDFTQGNTEVILNGKKIGMEELEKLSVEAVLPPGWENY